MSLSRSSGVMKLVENGEIFVNKPFDEVKSSIPSQVYLFPLRRTYTPILPGQHIHPGLLLPQLRDRVHVHVRVGDRRPGVQQRAE